MGTKFSLPSPWEEVLHTADVGVRARGATLEEVFARTALAISQLQSGGGEVKPTTERPIAAEGDDQPELLVDFCRAVLARFYDERLLLHGVEITKLNERALEAIGTFGPYDPDAHAEGMDVKAVTYARAGVQEKDGALESTVILDI